MKFNDTLVEIEGIEYDVPVIHETETVVIEANVNPSITLCDGTGAVKRIVTKEQLRRFEIDDTGNVSQG